MEHLWAPWRLQYILGEKETGCFFCRKSQEGDDAKNHVVIANATASRSLNTFPYNAGHLMVAPYKHTGELDDLSEQELSEFMALTRRCKQLLAKVIKPDGFNIGINLAVARVRACSITSICISCRAGTATRITWPVLADTHVVPQALTSCMRCS